MRTKRKCPCCGKDLSRLYSRSDTGNRNTVPWGLHCGNCGTLFFDDPPVFEKRILLHHVEVWGDKLGEVNEKG